MLSDVSAKSLVAKLPEASAIIYYAVEGTSGGLMYEQYENGVLNRSYVEVDGEVDTSRCLGEPPPRDEEFQQVDEWGLLMFAPPSSVSYEQIAATKHVHYRVSIKPTTFLENEVHAAPRKPWWRIW